MMHLAMLEDYRTLARLAREIGRDMARFNLPPTRGEEHIARQNWQDERALRLAQLAFRRGYFEEYKREAAK